MKIKIKDLEGESLSIAVALCEGLDLMRSRDYFRRIGKPESFIESLKNDVVILRGGSIVATLGDYTTSWALAGPIIEKLIDEGFEPKKKDSFGPGYKMLRVVDDQVECFFGPTPLVAGLRAYVASRLGEEIEIPAGLAAA